MIPALLRSARLCLAAYDNNPDPGNFGVSHVVHLFNAETDTQGFIFVNTESKTLEIVFRGTQSPFKGMGYKDLINDLLIHKTDFYGIRVHTGFARAALSILPDTLALLRNYPNYRIVIQGHSLGGAIAVLVAVVIRQRVSRSVELITFGQPRVSTTIEINKALSCSYIRVQNGADMFARLPWPIGYGHGGLNAYLPKNKGLGLLIENPPRLLKFRDRAFSFFKRGTSHRMTSYITKLDAIGAPA